MTPPYAAFAAFEALVQRAANEDVPARVDKPLLAAWGIAAGNESGLLTSLRSLGLIDADGRPTDDYGELRLSRPRRQAALVRCLRRAYPGLPANEGSEIDDDQLNDYFVAERGLTGQMVDKAMRFYRRLAVVAAATPDREGPRPAPPRATAPRSSPGLGASASPPAISREVEPTTAPPSRSPASIEAGEMRPGLTVVVQVPIDAPEEQLVELFRRVRRAWEKAHD